jgi:DinB superfamily
MTTAAPAAVREVEVFRHQTRMIHKVVEVNVQGVTHEESLIQPEPGGNCLNWVLGHLLWAYNGALPLLGQEPVMDKDAVKRYARGSSPLEEPAEAMDVQELLSRWDEATKRMDAGLANLTSEVLDRPAPNSPTGNPNETVRSLLTTLLFHQAYRTGQTGILRRIAGKEGAIR